MKIAYFDCIAGASGDMLLGSLIDAGLSVEELKLALAALNLPGYTVSTQRVKKNYLSAMKLSFQTLDEDQPARNLGAIQTILAQSSLSAEIRAAAEEVFRALAEAEAKIHGEDIQEIHFHELSSLDTILDIVGYLLALNMLGIEKVYASPLPHGRGFTTSRHGALPLPAPAVTELLKGVPSYGLNLSAELVTPTAAALLTRTVTEFGPLPPMRLDQTGYGAGHADLEIPNVLRVLIGQTEEHPGDYFSQDQITVLETNLDDMNPEFYAHVLERLFTAGALDITLIPVQMKKNRPGNSIQVLCRPEDAFELGRILFQETSTFGLRKYSTQRWILNREQLVVGTKYGELRVKIGYWETETLKFAPEYEDCKQLAQKTGLPLAEIYQEAIYAARAQLQNRDNSA